MTTTRKIAPQQGMTQQGIAVRQHRQHHRQHRCMHVVLAFGLLWAVSCLATAQAQGTLEGSREDIQRYNAEIQRLSGSAAPPPQVTPAQTAEPRTSPESAFAPSMPQLDFARVLRTQTRDRDPFELLPGLAAQDGGSGFRSSFLDDANLSRAWRLKALARGPSGGIAQIQLGRGEVVTVYDGDELSLEGRAYTVQVESDGLVLSFVPKDPNSQQLKVRVR